MNTLTILIYAIIIILTSPFWFAFLIYLIGAIMMIVISILVIIANGIENFIGLFKRK